MLADSHSLNSDLRWLASELFKFWDIKNYGKIQVKKITNCLV